MTIVVLGRTICSRILCTDTWLQFCYSRHRLGALVATALVDQVLKMLLFNRSHTKRIDEKLEVTLSDRVNMGIWIIKIVLNVKKAYRQQR